MDSHIPLSRPSVTDAEIEAVVSVLRTDRLSLGPRLEAFEAGVAALAGRRYAVGVNSGTSGLHLCVRALGLSDGDEVLTTPFSFIATTNAILFERARPVFVDIDPATYNMDPAAMAAAVTPRTRAILPVEVFGNTAHFDRYEQFALQRGLAMIEDSCEALGGSLAGRPAGSFGHCGVFAFYPNKQITTGEGGMIVTDDEQLAEMCRSMRNQGRGEPGADCPHPILGYNYRMSEIAAALGEAQLRRLEEILQSRRTAADFYSQLLGGVEEIHLPPMTDRPKAAWFVYVVRLADSFTESHRDQIMADLHAEGIGCSRYFPSIHLQPYVRKLLGTREGDFPVCEAVAARSFAIPFFTGMTRPQAERVAACLRKAILKVRPTVPAAAPAPAAPAQGAKPAPTIKVPFFQVRCQGRELQYVSEVLASGWLTTASKAFELERRFAQAVGAARACAVNSCTAALHLAAEAIGIAPGDHVFVPTMTFTATAEVLRYLGAEPVLLDVEYGTSLITPEILDRAAAQHPGVKAVMVVHYGGHPAAMIAPDGQGILDVCRRRGLRVVEDAAHAFPARIGGKMVGSMGDATCFSFYANKTITSGEGGMLTTNDPALAKRATLMRLHGIDRDVWDRFTTLGKKPTWEYDVVAPGYKYNLSDINAAVGLAQLEQAQDLWQKRYEVAQGYYRRLAGIPCIDLPVCHVPREDHAWHLFAITLHPDAPVQRDRLIELLAERNIGTSVHYKPLHRMSYYKHRYNLSPEDFPNAERIWRGCLSLPLYPSMTDEQLDYVCSTLAELLS
jgi:dTDP-4-amino-4,6-dideoxygalactose transaminase